MVKIDVQQPFFIYFVVRSYFMRTYKYTGLFRSAEGHEYTLEVNCNGYLQAMILLTADAIRSARHYQLATITDEKGDVRNIDDILKMGALIS